MALFQLIGAISISLAEYHYTRPRPCNSHCEFFCLTYHSVALAGRLALQVSVVISFSLEIYISELHPTILCWNLGTSCYLQVHTFHYQKSSVFLHFSGGRNTSSPITRKPPVICGGWRKIFSCWWTLSMHL